MSVTLRKTGPGSPNGAPHGAICATTPSMPGPVRRSPVRHGLAAILIASAGLMAGCASYGQDGTTTGAVPDDYRTRHPIVVSQSETSEDIVVSTHARELSPRDHDLTVDFARRFKRSGANSMAVMIPSGSRNEAAARRIA